MKQPATQSQTIAKSYRFDSGTVEQINELTDLLKESQKDVLQRAVAMLYANRASVLAEDIQQRTKKANG